MKARSSVRWLCLLLLLAAGAAPAMAWDVYAQSLGGAIPDVDKVVMSDTSDQSCWAAAAANLLAAAGWGCGAAAQDPQSRADHIYGQFTAGGKANPANAGDAMSGWLKQYGMKDVKGNTDYDANNCYVNVKKIQRGLWPADYNTLLDGLAAAGTKYSTVLWTLPGTRHFLTLVGGDRENNQAPYANNKQSVWHDSDRTVGGTPDDTYTSSFAHGWDLTDYQASDADEYDMLSPGLRAHFDPLAYWASRYPDMIGPLPMYSMAGGKAGAYGPPEFLTDTVMRLGGEFHPNLETTITLVVDYADAANMSVENQIYLLDDRSVRWNPAITPGDELGQVQFEWVLPYSPAFEQIVFPSAKYNTLEFDPSGGKDVLSWELTSVPEPATLSLLALGLVLGLPKGGLAMRRRR